jgi:hypothetical protein
VERHFQVVETSDQQVGLIYKSGRLNGVLPPATRRVYWRGPVEVRVELIDIATDYALSRAHAALLARPSAALGQESGGPDSRSRRSRITTSACWWWTVNWRARCRRACTPSGGLTAR